MAFRLVRTNFCKNVQKDIFRNNSTTTVNTANVIPFKQDDTVLVDEVIWRPYKYVLEARSKGLRKTVGRAFNYWLAIPEQKVEMIDKVVHMVHTNTLIVDDVQDTSVLRTNVPATHVVYGIPASLNIMMHCFLQPLQEVLTWENQKALEIYMTNVVDIYWGQEMEIYWRKHFICPTEDQYKKMVLKKTGGFFRMGIHLMELYSDKKFDFTKLMNILTLAFQISNDYDNLYHPNDMNYTCCSDLEVGTFSFPIIHALQNDSKKTEILYILRQRSKDLKVKKHFYSLIEDCGSFEYTRNVMEELKTGALEEIERLGWNPKLEIVLPDFFYI